MTEHVCLADESRSDDMDDMQPCCECRYWHDPGWGDELGMCRRYPPTTPCMEGGILEEHGIMVTDHPLVLWDGWCGEWKERE